MSDRMTGAELAVARHTVGLTPEELAVMLEVNPRTVRAWEAERDPIPHRIPEELERIDREHVRLVEAMAADGRVAIKRLRGAMPRGWMVAAAARARATVPELVVEWA